MTQSNDHFEQLTGLTSYLIGSIYLQSRQFDFGPKAKGWRLSKIYKPGSWNWGMKIGFRTLRKSSIVKTSLLGRCHKEYGGSEKLRNCHTRVDFRANHRWAFKLHRNVQRFDTTVPLASMLKFLSTSRERIRLNLERFEILQERTPAR